MRLSRHHALGLVALTLMWGLNWPIMKVSLRELSPLYFRALTMSVGAAALALYGLWRGDRLSVPRDAWGRVALLALPNILVWHVCSILGVAALASGRAATLGFTMPIWALILARVVYGQPFGWRGLGAALFAGVSIGLLVNEELGHIAGQPAGVAWMQVAAIGWAWGTLMMKSHPVSLPGTTLTLWMMVGSAAVLWPLAIVLEPAPTWHFSPMMWACLAWGALVNYGAAQVIWFAMARVLPPLASTFAIMAVPLVGTLSATWIAGEQPQGADLWAALFTILAIGVALIAPARRPT